MDSMKPTFDKYNSKWKSGDLSCVSVFNRFIVIASNCEFSRKILNSPNFVQPAVVDSMRYILCDDNWVFMDGKEHINYRRGLNVLFQRKALGIYLPIMDRTYQKHFDEWLSHDGSVRKYQWDFRELNMISSLRVFLGDFMPEHVAKKCSEEYFNITAALELVNFPIPLPGTKVYKAIKSREYIYNAFIESVKDARIRINDHGPVTCMLDNWLVAMRETEEECQREGKPAPHEFTDREIALTLMTFLFASQDATSSALTWTFQLLADHPETLKKVYDEQDRLRADDPDQPITLELMEKSTYLRQVVKESLRLRPPVLMVPYQTHTDFPISENYTVPANSMIIPTTYPALHDPVAYPDPEGFNPDRWGPEGFAEKHPKNFMVFGNGPHHCIGKEYAVLHLMSTVAQATQRFEFKHYRTPDSDHIWLFATTFPKDECVMSFHPRTQKPFRI
ncbi:cytochrome P450 [Gilbertella persicaria]|uniref:cytochrome P450 n=1 Tax=Gilbertella persicaria TaxID=101096 RepID=UPI0022211B65|nr:cytochrome P450 [Gilbertella persicaria]KAI8050151.1 cytochrome P450 [Gilbertella persicaria]